MSNPHQVDKSHLNALQVRLSHERARHDASKNESERYTRVFWIRQIEREIEAERAFLGLLAEPSLDLSDDELLNKLKA